MSRKTVFAVVATLITPDADLDEVLSIWETRESADAERDRLRNKKRSLLSYRVEEYVLNQ